ncbi:MAG: type II secretion system protein N [Burkholderiales bacterium]
MSRRRAVGYLFAGALFYVLFLVATGPAYWMETVANRLSHGKVALQQTRGTLWRGEGTLVLGPDQRPVRTGLRWTLRPLWLLAGRVRVEVAASGEQIDGRGTLQFGYRRIGLIATEVSLPASLAGLVYAPADLFEPAGRVRIAVNAAQLSAAGLDGEIEATWLDAGGRIEGLANVGDYRLAITGRGPSAVLRLDTLRGEINLAAHGEWLLSGDGAMRIEGALTAGPQDNRILPLLPDPRRSGNQYLFTMNARLPLLDLLGLKN